MKRAIAVLLVLALSAIVSATIAPQKQPFLKSHRLRGEAMAEAANAWLAALPADLKPRASLELEDAARLDWAYDARERQGVALAEQGPEARRALERLLQSVLSQQGYLKVHGVLFLEETLDRDPGLYHAAVYGAPSVDGPWAWRLEGHHLSLNVTVREGGMIAATPLFVGAQPRVVGAGPRAGFELFYEEEGIARELARSLDASQRERGLRAEDPPDDVVLVPGRTTDLDPVEGVRNGVMTPQQTHLLMRLLGQHVGVLHADLHLATMNRYRMDDIRDIRFLWVGGLEPGEPCYYRIHAPNLDYAIEYVNRGDHVHCAWRDLPEDFGGALAAAADEDED